FEEEAALWRVVTECSDGAEQEHWAHDLIMASGALSYPNKPDLPGVDDFAGEVYFTAQWPAREPELAGKRVGVIGTGSSGIQAIPKLAERAGHLTVFQRTPNWSVPAFNRAFTEEDQERIRAEYPQRRRKARVSGGGSPHVAYPK